MGPRREWQPSVLLVLTLPVVLLAGLQLSEGVRRLLPSHVGSTPTLHQVVQGGGLMGLLLLVAVALTAAAHKWSWTECFGWRRHPFWGAVGKGVATGLLLVPLAYGLSALIGQALVRCGLRADGQEAVRLLMDPAESTGWKVAMAFFAIGIAPMTEELLFRGLLLPAFRDHWSHGMAMWTQAVLFGMMHGNIPALIPLILVGFVFGELYARTGNLVASFSAHATFNCVPFLLLVSGVELLPGLE